VSATVTPSAFNEQPPPPYNCGVDTQPLSLDTPPDVEQRQIEAWRGMTPAEKISLVVRMTANVRQLALAGIRRRYPNAPPREQQLRLLQLLYGDELARAAFPELDRLDRP
jgi:hypothetical protein